MITNSIALIVTIYHILKWCVIAWRDRTYYTNSVARVITALEVLLCIICWVLVYYPLSL